MDEITVVGGGLAGLVAAIECAEAGRRVRLFEAGREPGGRARTLDGPFRANLGAHVIYADGISWAWLRARKLLPPARRGPLRGLRFYYGGRARLFPPAAFLDVRRLRGRTAPYDRDFRTWATRMAGSKAAEALSRASVVFAFDHDPGRLSAAFVKERGARVLGFPPAARYMVGGWGTLVEALARRAVDLGVRIESGARVRELPAPPVIVATRLADAHALLGDDSLRWEGTRCAVLDVGLHRHRGDAFAVTDLDDGCWVERFTAPDPSLAPLGHELVQGHTGLAPGESVKKGVQRLESVLDGAYPGWRRREVWRRRMEINNLTGAVDLPGTTWRDRPAIDRGNGIFLAGDQVAAPGLLSEVAFASASRAAAGALAWARCRT
jgi:phytoene dehydrogenase-like protein